MKKRVLLVTLHFDDTHQVIRRKNKLPQGMGAVFLAGALNSHTCEIKVYSELYSGPLEAKKLLGWPDMIVMTGVTNCFDRMLHITAYARTLNPAVIIVAGGAPVRALPRYSQLFFDHCCTGDIEQLTEIIQESFGREYVADNMIPRLDLAYWIGIHGHAESSRNCNFSCDFCSLTGEKARFKNYPLGYLERQLLLMGKRRTVHFIDNNFYGNDRDHFLERLDLIDHYRQKGLFKYWSALVTGDFFVLEENLRRASETGCVALYSGIESFDNQTLNGFNKRHSTLVPQLDIIEQTLEYNIAFWYGLILDVYERPIHALKDEMRYLFAQKTITLPGFLTLPIPLIGTPYFLKCLEEKRFLANTSIRHIDGATLCMSPCDPLDQAADFLKEMKGLRNHRMSIAKHAVSFIRNYNKTLSPEVFVYALASNALITMNNLFTGLSIKPDSRSHISSTERYEKSYRPAFQVDKAYEKYFSPTMLTDEEGNISDKLLPDILFSPHPSHLSAQHKENLRSTLKN